MLQFSFKHFRKKFLGCLILLQSVSPSVAGQDLSFPVEIKSELCSCSTPSTPTAGGCSVFRARVKEVQINHPEIILIFLDSALMTS